MRPLTGRWLQVLSDILVVEPHHRCADLFSGTGIWGLLLLSHGAGTVSFFESDRKSIHQVKDILSDWGSKGEMVEGDLPYSLVNKGPFDLIVCDPPFKALPLGRRVAQAAWGEVAPGGRLALRWPGREVDSPLGLPIQIKRTVGTETLFVYKKEREQYRCSLKR